MLVLVLIILFIFGLVFGSFFQVVGLRLPEGKSIINPPSHCEVCNKRLKWYELIPVISYIIQGGKCSKCKSHISIKYPIYELLTGILFCLCYIVFGFTTDFIIAISFVSILMIVIISDIEYMIISDEVLIVGSILILVETLIFKGLNTFLFSIFNGILCFCFMYLIKFVGDSIFKQESLGGGDIKLFFFFGLVFHIKTAIVIIFLASFIALPYAIITMMRKKDNIVPFGPFLSITTIILLLFNLTNVSLLDLINYLA